MSEGLGIAREGIIAALDRSRLEELEELNRLHHPRRRLSLLLSWLGGWLGALPRAEAEPLPDVGTGEVGVTFGGHATVLARFPSLSVLVDPLFSRRLGLIPRAVQPGLTAGEVTEVDLILISNAAADHLHRPSLARLPRAATLVVPPRCAELVSDLGFARVVELSVGQSFRHRGVDVASTPVRGRPGGRGACGWMLRGSSDEPGVFVCTASGYFSGFLEIGQRYQPDVAVLPIGGYVPRALRAENMSPLDAIYAFEDLGARMLVPVRHGAFALSYETLSEPLGWLRELVTQRELERYVTVLAAGASAKFVKPAR
jgi:L-ascorbate metabolism protein UlaG (beta-lactamase superfamily)